MGLAMHLGVDDLDSPLMRAVCGSWARWCTDDPELAVVETLTELPEWTRHACGEEKDAVLSRLAGLTAYERDAAVALAWLLLPGATRVAAELSDLHPDIDGLVAGQLWIEVSGAHRLRPRRVAATILARTRREVAAELGVGDLATRRDRVWAEAVRMETDENLPVVADGHESLDDLFDQITDLMIDAMDANAIDASTRGFSARWHNSLQGWAHLDIVAGWV